VTTGHHLESLDVFRGATMAAMIVVNNPGDWNAVFPPLQHAGWSGWTAADAVFPFFVFIMGCAMPFAFARRKAQASGRWYAAARIARRALILIALGLALNLVAALPHAARMRVPGVLQRIGLAYLGAAIVVRSFGAVTQALVAAALLIGHWVLLTLVPLGSDPAAFTQTHNLAAFVDMRAFGSHTLTPGFDPEGLLGTLPTVATALAGALAGQWLRLHADYRRQMFGLVAGGVAAIAAGLAWSLIWPISKPLWTGSYALLMAGLASVVLAACLYVVDVRGPMRWTRPLAWLGANPLAIYFCSELVAEIVGRSISPRVFAGLAPKDWLYWHAFGGEVSREWSSLLFALSYVAIWIGVSAVLHQRGIRVRV
jgi:predicted acyltransferase